MLKSENTLFLAARPTTILSVLNTRVLVMECTLYALANHCVKPQSTVVNRVLVQLLSDSTIINPPFHFLGLYARKYGTLLWLRLPTFFMYFVVLLCLQRSDFGMLFSS